MTPVQPAYQPRDAEQGVRHTVIREHLEPFLRKVSDRDEGGGLPRFVDQSPIAPDRPGSRGPLGVPGVLLPAAPVGAWEVAFMSSMLSLRGRRPAPARDFPRPEVLDRGSGKEDHPGVRSTRALLALVLAAVLIGLTPAAYADPPDPTWVSGFWDDDDFDNTVVIIANTCATEALAPVDAGPVLAPAARVEPEDPVDPPILLRSNLCYRAPPVPSSSHC